MKEILEFEKIVVICVLIGFVVFVNQVTGCTEKADVLKAQCGLTKTVDECNRLIRH